MVAVMAVSVFGDPSGIWGTLEPVFGYRSPPERVDGKAILSGDIKGVKPLGVSNRFRATPAGRQSAGGLEKE